MNESVRSETKARVEETCLTYTGLHDKTKRHTELYHEWPALQFFFAFFASFFCETRGEKKVEGLEVRLNKRRYVYAGTHHRLSIPWGEIKAARSSRKRGVVGSSRGGFEIQEAEVLSC
jgi:hypothetical protein